MSFVISGDRGDFLAAFTHIERFAGNSSANASLGFIHLKHSPDNTYIEASDQKMSARMTLFGIAFDVDELDVLIHSKIRKVIATIPSGEVTVTHLDGGMVEVKGKGRAKYQVPVLLDTEYPDIFPGVEKVVWDDIVPIDAGNALEAMARSSRYASRKDNAGNPSITGINLRVVDDQLAIDSTDSYRCYQEKVNLPTKGFPFGENEVILPVNMVVELTRLFPGGEILFSSDSNLFLASDPARGTLFASRRIGGKYPNMDTIVKMDDYKVSTTVPREPMVAALKRITGLVGNNPVKVSLKDSDLDLLATGGEGNAEEWVGIPDPIKEPIAIGFNTEQLLSAFEAFDADEVELSVLTSLRPAVLTAAGEEKRFIIMPIRMA